MTREDRVKTALAWLKMRIEDLSAVEPMWSASARTHRGTAHVIFQNGAMVQEGELPPPGEKWVGDIAEATLAAVRKYRNAVGVLPFLVWRVEPEYRENPDGTGSIYCRLCFEPSLDEKGFPLFSPDGMRREKAEQ